MNKLIPLNKIEGMLQRLGCITYLFKLPCLSKMKKLNQIILGKSALYFNKRANLFDKKALGKSRRAGGG